MVALLLILGREGMWCDWIKRAFKTSYIGNSLVLYETMSKDTGMKKCSGVKLSPSTRTIVSWKDCGSWASLCFSNQAHHRRHSPQSHPWHRTWFPFALHMLPTRHGYLTVSSLPWSMYSWIYRTRHNHTCISPSSLGPLKSPIPHFNCRSFSIQKKARFHIVLLDTTYMLLQAVSCVFTHYCPRMYNIDGRKSRCMCSNTRGFGTCNFATAMSWNEINWLKLTMMDTSAASFARWSPDCRN